MRTYYFNNSARVYDDKLVVIGEAKYSKLQYNSEEGWNDNCVSGQFRNLSEAKKYFRKEWFKDQDKKVLQKSRKK